MRAVIQRVSEASVQVDSEIVGKISTGYVVLLGIEETDSLEDIDWLCKKIINLRLFNDTNDKMNLSIADIGGEILIISQFTLFASTKKGNRPSFIKAAKPETAIPLYEEFVKKTTIEMSKPPKTGIFGADMKVSLINDGPVTIMIDSKNRE